MPILAITVVLRTVQIAKSRISISQVFSVSLKAAVRFSKITRSGDDRHVDGDQHVDPRSRAKCLFVKQIRTNIYNFVFNVNNLPLAKQSRKIYSNSSIRTTRVVRPRLQSQSLNSQDAMIRALPCTSKRK